MLNATTVEICSSYNYMYTVIFVIIETLTVESLIISEQKTVKHSHLVLLVSGIVYAFLQSILNNIVNLFYFPEFKAYSSSFQFCVSLSVEVLI